MNRTIEAATGMKASLLYVFLFLAIGTGYNQYYEISERWEIEDIEKTPREYYFDYDRIEVVEPVIIGEPLRFRSYVDRRDGIDLEFNDTLFCDLFDGQGFANYSTAPKAILHDAPKSQSAAAGRPWIYQGATPRRPAECFLRAVPKVLLPYDLKKRQVITTEKFFFRIPESG